MSGGFLWAALVFYGLGLVLTIPSVIRRRRALTPATLCALGLGVISHAGSIVAGTARLHHLPVADVRSALSLFSFLVILAFFFVYLRYRVTFLGLFILPLVFLLTLVSAFRPGRSFEPIALGSPWLKAHIALTILGYTGFFLTFVAATMYLIQERELKSKTPRAYYYRLPSLEVCDQLYYRSLFFGFPFLSLGLLMGFVRAISAWRGVWELDPKIIASLATWLIYLVLFSTRLSSNWRGRRAAYVAIFGFAAMMVTFLGVSWVSGQHGYSPKIGGAP